MPFECDDVPVTIDLNGGYLTLAPIGYRGSHERFEIEAGFYTDLATTPRWLTPLAPVAGLVALAAILHDWLLRIRRIRWEKGAAQPVSSVDIDGLFRRCLREAWWQDPVTGRIKRINRVERGLYWLGVRWGALFSAYRREGWWRTAHVVLPLSLLLAPFLLVYALASLLVLGGAFLAGKLLALVWPDPIPPSFHDTCDPVVDATATGFVLRRNLGTDDRRTP